MLQVSAVIEAFAGSVSVLAVELGSYVPHDASRFGVVLKAVGYANVCAAPLCA